MNIARLKQSRAFTLIELIVVIVILGILVAIGAFAYNNIIDGTRQDAASKVAGQVAKDIAGKSALDQKPIQGATGVVTTITASTSTPLANTAQAWTGDFADSIYLKTLPAGTAGPVFMIKNASGKCADITFTTNTVGSQFTVANNTSCS